VRANEPEDLALLQVERDAVECDDAAEPHRDIANLEQRGAAHSSSRDLVAPTLPASFRRVKPRPRRIGPSLRGLAGIVFLEHLRSAGSVMGSINASIDLR